MNTHALIPEQQTNRVLHGKVRVNGSAIAFYVRGSGPPLVLIMGYRLNADAWPDDFVEGFARRFTVIAIDNRGTGNSDKPVEGYALSSMAADVLGVLDHLAIARAHILGYSMGGAIAQEFACHYPERVAGLVLCATMYGGSRAIRAPLSILRIMRNLDGLEPEEIARRVWKVTYAPDYLAKNLEKAEHQLQREMVSPTPLHASDLQFQGLAEFDTSQALPFVHAPTLVLTGALDQLVPPDNSLLLSELIPNATLHVLPGCGHRLMWEAATQCVTIITSFLKEHDSSLEEDVSLPATGLVERRERSGLPDLMSLFMDHWRQATKQFVEWPLTLEDFFADLMLKTIQPMYFGRKFRAGDGKPVVLIPPRFVSDIGLWGFSLWLRSIGYRPVSADILFNFDDQIAERALTQAIYKAAQRVGRKAVILAFGTGLETALRVADSSVVSDIVVLGAPPWLSSRLPEDIRLHVVAAEQSGQVAGEAIGVHRITGLPAAVAMSPEALLILSDILRNIRISFVDSDLDGSNARGDGEQQ
jgi:pimeloyl-ACP methyl ester carboxylesterase